MGILTLLFRLSFPPFEGSIRGFILIQVSTFIYSEKNPPGGEKKLDNAFKKF